MVQAHFKDIILFSLMNYCKVGTVRLKKTYEGVKVELHTFLASDLNGGEW
jgi:hypothetical protein